MATIGILSLQGGFAAHQRILSALGHDTLLIKTPEQLLDIEGLVLPGGESSTQLKLIHHAKLFAPLIDYCQSERPVFGTCAGLILLARDVRSPQQESLGQLDVVVERNAWGRQRQSFEARSEKMRWPMLFIRAPKIVSTGEHVEWVDTYQHEPVIVRQGNIFGATFHPELTDDMSIHQMIFGCG
ncbi:MAG: pyridoxal 5'-phosphate synthase glutaminase subunit PdxT [Deltaproteobacteria bacterium]|nr:pyridoxal 5'-phosphate synthase glutaminase subunit PdxT [Deltaproteobacteria bacterium]MBU47258.1 pyridoxal 5'-phosphate synthase glutaminase subunit PdxT [Deltaproteobacteria bacterium]|tara:strand:- start:4087 stop:4638 length:552 start_codon:yes stop_codon:yes gene_type:complete